tara:strand:+ start:50 stop:937 length:888 start_codon:yes stop_codon:yes gene_type:complete
MTALKKYTRLETTGLWKASPNEEPVEVIVSIGSSSLVLSGLDENPLSHWSLLSIKCLSKSNSNSVFSPDSIVTETLEIEDKDMTEALLLITSQESRSPKRRVIIIPVILLLALICFFFLITYIPTNLKSLTSSVISSEQELRIIKPLLSNHTMAAGPTCQTEQGQIALKNLLLLQNENSTNLSITILKNQTSGILHLPSGNIILSGSFINSLKEPSKLLAIIEKIRLENDNRTPLKKIIAEQHFLYLIKFLFGLEKTLIIENISMFEIHPNVLLETDSSNFDDFSWVALKNICIS